MGPHADFACLSPKCQQDGAATVYDLPVNATRCPVCGSKRIQRIWTPPNIGRGVAKHVDGTVEGMWNQMHDVKESAKRAEANMAAIEDRVRHEVPLIPYAERDRLAEQHSRIHALPMRQAAPQYVGRDVGGKSEVPGLAAGAPIPSSGRPAIHAVPQRVVDLHAMTTVAGRDTVKP